MAQVYKQVIRRNKIGIPEPRQSEIQKKKNVRSGHVPPLS